MTNGYDNLETQRSTHLSRELMSRAWKGKGELVNAPVSETYSLKDVKKEQITETISPGDNRINIQQEGIKKLTFSETNMLIGLFAASYDTESEAVTVLYPHVKEGKTENVTKFQMNVADAWVLLDQLLEYQHLDKKDIAKSLTTMHNRFSSFSEEAMRLHENDASTVLGERLAKE